LIDETKILPPIECEINEINIDRNVLNFKPIPETPISSSWWHTILSMTHIQNLDYKYSRVKTCLTLNLSGMSIYGMIRID
jgi:hypothetical protein